MKRKLLYLSLLALSISGLPSCSADDVLNTSTPQQVQQPVDIEFEATVNNMELGDLFADETRAIKYDLSGDYKMPTLNFGAANDAATDVPIHLFFRNTQDGKTHYALLKMSKVLSAKSLYRNFGAIDMKGKLTTANIDSWYVKAFIGGYPEKSTGGNLQANHTESMSDGSANRIRFLMNATPDITGATTSYAIPHNYYNQGKGTYGPAPLPLQTDWTKFTFSHLPNGANNPKYKSGALKFSFKPLGLLLRVRIENKGKMPLRMNTFALHNAIENVDDAGNPSVAYSAESMVLLNNVAYTFDKALTITQNKVNESASRTFSAVNEGKLTYHWYNNGNGSKTVTVEPGTYRVVYAWMHHNELNPSVTEMLFKPSFYVGNATDYADYVTQGTEKVELPLKKISRSKFVAGKSYPIKIVVYSKENVTIASDLSFKDFTHQKPFIVAP